MYQMGPEWVSRSIPMMHFFTSFFCEFWGYNLGDTQIIVLYACATRETQKKGCFLRLNANRANHILGNGLKPSPFCRKDYPHWTRYIYILKTLLQFWLQIHRISIFLEWKWYFSSHWNASYKTIWFAILYNLLMCSGKTSIFSLDHGQKPRGPLKYKCCTHTRPEIFETYPNHDYPSPGKKHP